MSDLIKRRGPPSSEEVTEISLAIVYYRVLYGTVPFEMKFLTYAQSCSIISFVCQNMVSRFKNKEGSTLRSKRLFTDGFYSVRVNFYRKMLQCINVNFSILLCKLSQLTC